MALYTPVVGIITNIESFSSSGNPASDCTILYTLEGENPAGTFQVQLPANAYVMIPSRLGTVRPFSLIPMRPWF